jgi:hypothetical protein
MTDGTTGNIVSMTSGKGTKARNLMHLAMAMSGYWNVFPPVKQVTEVQDEEEQPFLLVHQLEEKQFYVILVIENYGNTLDFLRKTFNNSNFKIWPCLELEGVKNLTRVSDLKRSEKEKLLGIKNMPKIFIRFLKHELGIKNG